MGMSTCLLGFLLYGRVESIDGVSSKGVPTVHCLGVVRTGMGVSNCGVPNIELKSMFQMYSGGQGAYAECLLYRRGDEFR